MVIGVVITKEVEVRMYCFEALMFYDGDRVHCFAVAWLFIDGVVEIFRACCAVIVVVNVIVDLR